MAAGVCAFAALVPGLGLVPVAFAQPEPPAQQKPLTQYRHDVWQTPQGLKAAGHDAHALKNLWRNRKFSLAPADTSGVWRFRELLPALKPDYAPITLREGNTPLYDLPRCARVAGVRTLQAKHQGMNPTASFKDTGMTTASSFATRSITCTDQKTIGVVFYCVPR